MSSTHTTSKAGATFQWVLGAFVSFAILFWGIQTLFVIPGEMDPRAPERLANSAEIAAQQNELLVKMGLNEAAKKVAVFDKALQTLKARPETISAQLVPGSPTQLKQAAEAPPPAPAVDAATPAPAPAPQN